MGDPKSPRRTYDKPKHPWQGDRIKAENEIIKKYGLKNKKELWKAQTLLRGFRQRSRELQALVRYENKQAEKERSELLGKLGSLGLLPLEGASLNDVLALDIEAILSRRFQTMAYVKGLAYSTKQSRQLIVHGHAAIGDRKVTIPGYYVKRNEENLIRYSPDSPLANELHPSRPDVDALSGPPAPEKEVKAEPEAKEAKKEVKAEPEAKEAKKEVKAEPEAKGPKKEAKGKAKDEKEDKKEKEDVPAEPAEGDVETPEEEPKAEGEEKPEEKAEEAPPKEDEPEKEEK